MNFSDIQIYIIIKLILIAFAVVSIFLIYKKSKPIYFLMLAGIASAVSYAFFVNDMGLMFWGLQGDELTIAAMYNTFAKIGFGSDFAFHKLAPFYPPLFFWFFALIGKIMNWNGIITAKVASFSFLLTFPLLLYFLQKIFLKDFLKNQEKSFGKILFWLSPILIITILDKDLLIGKPYEIITGAATVFWFCGLVLIAQNKKITTKSILLYGITGGLIFMTYYLWIIFAAIALFVYGIIEKKKIFLTYFFNLFKIGLVTITVSLPFILPLLLNYLKNGIENWQTAFFMPNGLDLWLPMFKSISITNLILFGGFITLIYFKNNPFIKSLLYLFITAFVWWGIGMFCLLVFEKPLQEFRGFYIFAPTILTVATGFGIEKLWHRFNINENKNFYYTLTITGLLIFISYSFFGFFIDDPLIKNRLIESKTIQKEISNLIKFLEKEPDSSSVLTLQTAPQIMAFTPINNLIYFNQHNNHPGSIFSKRHTYVTSLSNSKTGEEFYEKIKNCPYGKLEQFILYGDEKNYYLFFHLNKIIDGIKEEIITINKKLFLPEYFEIKYNNNNYTVLRLKSNLSK